MDANEQKARELLAAEYAKAYAEPFGAPIDSHAIAVRVIAKALAQQVPADGEWVPSGADYDRSIHSNPDAKAWADFFVATFPGQADKHDLMLGWFANAMMAMHDHLKQSATAQAPQPVVDAPSVADSKAMGAKGGPSNEAERLAFEAWMRGHCWALCATWDGAGYRGDAEQSGRYCPDAARTRGLWAAWRDRAALAASQPQQGAVACGFRYRVAPNEECRSRPWTGAGIVAEWNQPTPPDNETIQYQTLYTTIGQQAVDDACNCPGGSKPASMHAPNCPVRTTENK